MQSNSKFREIYKSYIPTEKEGIVLFSIYNKIKTGEINEYFSHEDIRYAISEVHGSDYTHVHDFIGGLLTQFIERPHRREEGKYRLTEYAVNFIELILDQVNSLRKKYSLRDTLQQFALIEPNNIRTFQDLERWFQQSFTDIARRTINDHIAGLNSQLKESLKQLNNILHNDNRKIGEKIVEFSKLFLHISEKASDVQQTMQLKFKLFEQLDILTERLYEDIDDTKSGNLNEHKTLLYNNYLDTRKITQQVHSYFHEVEDKLNSIIDKLQFAEEKLTELQNNFNLYANRRINLKRLFNFYLDHTVYNAEEGVDFTIDLPQKGVLDDYTRFIEIKKFDFGFRTQTEKFLPNTDTVYFNKEREYVDNQLEKQEITNILIGKILNTLEEEGHIDLSDYFWDIYISHNDVEIAATVCFDVINYISTSNEFSIEITNEIQVSSDNTISICKMKLTRTI